MKEKVVNTIKALYNVLQSLFFFFFYHTDRLLASGAIFFLYLYQKTLSPDRSLLFGWLRGRICAHDPHCSQYAIECFRRYGFFCGLTKTLDRISRCNPSIAITYDPPKYRVVFFSSAPIGIPFLEALRNDPMTDIVGVVTMPDEPQGRGMQPKPNVIKQRVERKIHEETTAPNVSKKQKKDQTDAIQDNNIPFVVTPPTLSQKTPQGQDFLKRIEQKHPDYLVVIAYGYIIPQAILDVPKILPINVHGSLLPKLRGASPIQSVFFEKNEPNAPLVTGITLIKMTKEMDAGPILGKVSFPVPFERTSIDVIRKMEKIGPSFLLKVMKRYPKGYINLQEQNENEVTYCTKYTKQDGQVNPWVDTLENIYAKYRAFALRPKIRFVVKDAKNGEKRIIVEYLEVEKDLYYQWKEKPLFTNPTNELPQQQFINPAVRNFLVKPEGKKTMTRSDFLNGNKK